MTEPGGQSLRELLRQGPATPRDPDEIVWHIPPVRLLGGGKERQRVSELRSAVLNEVLASDTAVFLRPPSEPPEPELQRYLRLDPSGAWRLTEGRADPVSLLSELRDGGWFLYAGPQPLATAIPDTFRSPGPEVVDFMQRGALTRFIDSFHDDTEWVVGIQRGTT